MTDINVTETCRRYNSYQVKNGTFIQISDKYEGIPQNLAINFVSYLILIAIFICLRKKAWNYGKLAWLNKPKHPFSTLTDKDSHQEYEGDLEFTDNNPLNGYKRKSFVEKVRKMIPLFIKMSDEQLHQRCGPDAVTYCQFQRYLMVTVAVMMFFSLSIILPCNLSGHLLGNITVFAASTIGNLEPDKPIIWAHFTVSLTLMLFAFVLSTRFLANIDVKGTYEFSYTIMIKNIPVDWCDELSIQTHFQQAYPTVKVQKVQVVHKVNKLIYIDAEKQAAEEALQFCYDQVDSGGERVMVVPHMCGRTMACKCCKSEKCIPVDGVEYYQAEVIRLNNMFIEEKSNVVNSPNLPIVFVTFEDIEDSLLVRRDYVYQNYCCIEKVPIHTSSLSKELKSSQWNVVFAPIIKDIIWQNLHKRGWKLWTGIILVNMVVAFIVIFLSTPPTILTILDKLNISQNFVKNKGFLGSHRLSVIVAQFIPSLILVIVNSLMPVLVYWSDQVSGHWTKTKQNKAIMNKLYTILLATVLILPSLGLTSVYELVLWLFPKTATFPDKFQWKCIFLPDGGALFCNYLITAAFIGTALELLRLGELFLYSCKLLFSKSRAEDQTIAKNVLWEFQFGLSYAWTLALFTVTSAYAVIVPLVTPFGLSYLFLKHFVDRYNLIHVNSYSVIHHSVHTNAAQLMQIGLILTQATVMIYVTLRLSSVSPISICCCAAFVLGILLTFGRTVRRWISGMSFMKYSLPKPATFDDTEQTAAGIVLENEDFIYVDDLRHSSFIPLQMRIEEPAASIEELMLRKSRLSLASQMESPSRRSYGSQS